MAGDRPLTTSEAAAGLGVSRSTVKNWIKEFSLSAMRDARGDWRIAPEHLPIFEEVKRLRDEGLGLDSIRRVIGAPQSPPVTVAFVEQQPQQARPGLVTRFMPEAEEPEPPRHSVDFATFEAALEHQSRLAMQLARLAQINGHLQAQVKQLQGQLALAAAAPLEELEAARERLAEVEMAKEGGEMELLEMNERLIERDEQLDEAKRQIEALVRSARDNRPRSGMGFAFAQPSEDKQVLELQRELIKSKERIAALEAEEYARTERKKPWWNFWD